MTRHHSPAFSWNAIDRVFLDLDGTLLDKYFDDFFWEEYVPKVYSQKNNVDPKACRELLLSTYKRVESTLQWTDLNYWSEQLGLDIAALKDEITHLINIHPYVTEFLEHLKDKGKEIYLVTNAHPKALEVKLGKIQIADAFSRIICSQDVGLAKEQIEFWDNLQTIQRFHKERTLFVDDTERVLDSARAYGLKHLIHIAKPSSKLPPAFSSHYPSIESFQDLLF